MYDVTSIREDFPVLKDVIYLDSAATTQTPVQVVTAMNDYFYRFAGNYGRGAHRLARETTNHYEESREKVASFLNVDHSKIIFTKNTTEGINMVAKGMEWHDGDHIITTLIEHHSNFVPWLNLKRCGIDVDVIEPDSRGIIDPADIDAAISDNTRLIAISHVSNVFGSIQDIESIIRIAHRNDIQVLVDGAQSAGHMVVDISALNCDFFATSGHKGLLGPQGTGIMYIKDPDDLEPVYLGGGTVHGVGMDSFELEPFPARFEAGTPNIPGVIGLGRSIEYIQDIGIKNIEKHENELTEYAISRLSEIPMVETYGPENRTGVIPFNISGMNSHDVAMIMDETKRICVRSGYHCAMPAIEFLKMNGAVRASFGLYNTMEEVDVFADTVSQITSLVS